ncbi:hypothetical protein [Hymenobacter sp. BT491]|uniref:hypothetical protein n=1 Tax=Hymenobacter sp. BT491 TaxID=2766779 RepID=UPI0016536CA9|nr:hypothetical protein [Hymenobacter sp. BT491]MBC6992243.1 hypothetical protein [Hymenobacter sp. BT491]
METLYKYALILPLFTWACQGKEASTQSSATTASTSSTPAHTTAGSMTGDSIPFPHSTSTSNPGTSQICVIEYRVKVSTPQQFQKAVAFYGRMVGKVKPDSLNATQAVFEVFTAQADAHTYSCWAFVTAVSPRDAGKNKRSPIVYWGTKADSLEAKYKKLRSKPSADSDDEYSANLAQSGPMPKNLVFKPEWSRGSLADPYNSRLGLVINPDYPLHSYLSAKESRVSK